MQQRKPTLWLPLRATLPEDEKTKPPRAPWKSGGSDTVKRRESAKVAAIKRRECSGQVKKSDEVKDSILVGTNKGVSDTPEDS